MLLAAVDLGSNSFRMEFGRIVDGKIQREGYRKETIRLAAGLDENGALRQDVQDRALACLKRFRTGLNDLPAQQVRAVGTQALRVATNAAAFLEKAQETLGYPIEILSGREEARLAFQGCAQSLPKSSEPRLVVDIGGASTECIIGIGDTPITYESLHIGCVNTSVAFFPDGIITRETMHRAVVATSAEFEKIAVRFTPDLYTEAYGSAGTFGAVSELCSALGWSDGAVTREHLETIEKYLLDIGTISKITFPGLKDDRKEVIAGGIAVLLALYRTFNISDMRPATGAVRAGVLQSLYNRLEGVDARDETVRQMLERSGTSAGQAERVCAIALSIATGANRSASPAALVCLRRAALLHEIGKSINPSHYHYHGHYIVSHADMPGFSRAEQHHVARLILAHRGNLTKVADLLSSPEHLLQTVCLRLAVIMAHSRRITSVPDMSLTLDDGHLSFAVSKVWLEQHPQIGFLLEKEADRWTQQGLRFSLLKD